MNLNMRNRIFCGRIFTMTIIEKIKGKVIVSSQAMPGEPFYDEKCMLAMMESVVNGGAGGLRVAGARDVRNAKKFNIPVIGLTKPEKLPENWKEVVYITPTLKEVNELIEADADIIAFDGTSRDRNGCTLKEIIDTIHEADKLAMADVSTIEEGLNSINLGADIVSTTLSGYTKESGDKGEEPDFELLKNLVKLTTKPVILEGRIWTPEEVKKGFDLGAYAVIIGSAITRPQLITRRFIG